MKKLLPLYTILAILMSMPLYGCGIKPSDVEPPGGKKTEFPRTYPDIRLDQPAPMPH
jgi:hypothetical protein